MFQNKSILAIIPARGGSKRLPQKNLQEIGGFPMIWHSIKAAKASEYIDKIIVSSDDREIIKTAAMYGCETHEREAYLSTDNELTFDLIRTLVKIYRGFDSVITLQPTSPLRSEIHVDQAIRLFYEKGADAVVSVCKADHPVEWLGKIKKDLRMDKFKAKFKQCALKTSKIPIGNGQFTAIK